MNLFLRDSNSVGLYPLDAIHFPHFNEIISKYDLLGVLAKVDHVARVVTVISEISNQPLKKSLEKFIAKMDYEFVYNLSTLKLEIKTFPETFDMSDLEALAKRIIADGERYHSEEEVERMAKQYVGEYLKSLK